MLNKGFHLSLEMLRSFEKTLKNESNIWLGFALGPSSPPGILTGISEVIRLFNFSLLSGVSGRASMNPFSIGINRGSSFNSWGIAPLKQSFHVAAEIVVPSGNNVKISSIGFPF